MSYQISKSRRISSTKAKLIATFVAGLISVTCLSQALPQIDPGWDKGTGNVLYQEGVEVGRVYRDGIGDLYAEHWVLYPNYSYDTEAEPGDSVEIKLVKGAGYRDFNDFLTKVPFPKGSRYVEVLCAESFELPKPKNVVGR